MCFARHLLWNSDERSALSRQPDSCVEQASCLSGKPTGNAGASHWRDGRAAQGPGFTLHGLVATPQSTGIQVHDGAQMARVVRIETLGQGAVVSHQLQNGKIEDIADFLG